MHVASKPMIVQIEHPTTKASDSTSSSFEKFERHSNAALIKIVRGTTSSGSIGKKWDIKYPQKVVYFFAIVGGRKLKVDTREDMRRRICA